MTMHPFRPVLSRRELLWRLGGGLGGIALTHLLGREGLLADAAPQSATRHPPPATHHPPKAKCVIQLFMNGGASQCDTFDYKPELIKRHGQKFDPGTQVEAVTSTPGQVMKSPFAFKQHGKCGRWVSSVFPHIAGCVDDLAFLMAMASKTNVHGPASYMMNTGFVLPGFPCLGAWLSYGLGSLNDNLPTFVVLPDLRGLPYNQRGNFSSGFLPVLHQGTIIKANAPNPIADLFPPPSAKFINRASEAEGLSLLQEMNREHADRWQGDSRLDARIASYELAAKMQVSAGSAGHRQRDRGDAPAIRPGRQDHRDVRPQLPARSAADRARRALRAGVERRGRAVEQLGQSQQHQHGVAEDRHRCR